MTFASLFSGIGAPDLAAVKLGWEHKFWCEVDPFCQQVLKYWFNKSEGYGDIRESDFSKWRGKIDVLHGSSPCQAVSISGKRRGDKDDRWLWGEMLRAICDIRPTWVTFENVANLKNMVSSNEKPIVENGEHYVLQEGMFYGIIQDLENAGYEVQSYLIPACAVGAPHERKRIWLVGYSADASNARAEMLRGRPNEILSGRNASESGIKRCRSGSCDWEERPIYTEFEWDMAKGEPEWNRGVGRTCEDGEDGDSTIANSELLESRNADGKEGWSVQEKPIELSGLPGNWEMFPTQSPVCGRDDGISFGLDPKAFPRWRRESLKALGNALVPQVIYEIYKSINEIEDGKEK